MLMDFTFLVVEREKTTKKEIQTTSQWLRMKKMHHKLITVKEKHSLN